MLSIKRPLYGILWFFILFIAAFIIGGTAIGIHNGLQNLDPKKATYAISKILERYSNFIALPVYIVTYIGSLLGFFPGTKRNRTTTDTNENTLETTDDNSFDFSSVIALTLYAFIIQFGLNISCGTIADILGIPYLITMPSIQITLSALATLAITIFTIHLAKHKLSRPAYFPYVKTLLIPILFAIVIGTVIVESEISNMQAQWFKVPNTVRETLDAMLLQGSLSLFLFCIVIPLAEEILFRGVILGFFVKKYPIQRAIFLSSLAFAVLHAGPYHFIPAFGIGLLLGWLYHKTGALWLCMVFSSVHNVALYAVANHKIPYVIQGFTSFVNGQSRLQPLWFDVLGIGLVAGGIYALLYFFRDTEETPES